MGMVRLVQRLRAAARKARVLCPRCPPLASGLHGAWEYVSCMHGGERESARARICVEVEWHAHLTRRALNANARARLPADPPAVRRLPWCARPPRPPVRAQSLAFARMYFRGSAPHTHTQIHKYTYTLSLSHTQIHTHTHTHMCVCTQSGDVQVVRHSTPSMERLAAKRAATSTSDAAAAGAASAPAAAAVAAVTASGLVATTGVAAAPHRMVEESSGVGSASKGR